MGRVRGLTMVDGILFREGRIFLPPQSKLLQSVFEASHASAMAGHRSVPATVARMQESVTTRNLAEWVMKRVAACPTCLAVKADTRRSAPLNAVYTAPSPFHTLHVDALMGLPPVKGFDKVWVAVDRFTHFVFLVPAASTDTAADTAQRLLNGVFAWVGLPVELISDCDPLFTSEFTQGLFRLMGLSHQTSTPRRKQADGLCERQMRTLREYLRAFGGSQGDKWLEL